MRLRQKQTTQWNSIRKRFKVFDRKDRRFRFNRMHKLYANGKLLLHQNSISFFFALISLCYFDLISDTHTSCFWCGFGFKVEIFLVILWTTIRLLFGVAHRLSIYIDFVWQKVLFGISVSFRIAAFGNWFVYYFCISSNFTQHGISLAARNNHWEKMCTFRIQQQ